MVIIRRQSFNAQQLHDGKFKMVYIGGALLTHEHISMQKKKGLAGCTRLFRHSPGHAACAVLARRFITSDVQKHQSSKSFSALGILLDIAFLTHGTYPAPLKKNTCFVPAMQEQARTKVSGSGLQQRFTTTALALQHASA